jgi:hypothetical protein
MALCTGFALALAAHVCRACQEEGAGMTHLKQHVFKPATGICISCGADLQEGHLPCDHALKSAPDCFERDDPRWQAEESENTLKPGTTIGNRADSRQTDHA